MNGRGGGTIAEFIDVLSKYSLWGLQDKITCPYFNIGGQARGNWLLTSEILRQADLSKARHIITRRRRRGSLWS